MTGLRHKLNYVLHTFVKHTPDHCLFIYFVVFDQLIEILFKYFSGILHSRLRTHKGRDN